MNRVLRRAALSSAALLFLVAPIMSKRKQISPQIQQPSFYDFVRAAEHDHHEARTMLATNSAWLFARSLSGETALHYLAIEGCRDAVEFLLRAGAEPALVTMLVPMLISPAGTKPISGRRIGRFQ